MTGFQSVVSLSENSFVFHSQFALEDENNALLEKLSRCTVSSDRVGGRRELTNSQL